jgi:hypothetical protein
MTCAGISFVGHGDVEASGTDANAGGVRMEDRQLGVEFGF